MKQSKPTERARTGSGALNAMRREGFVPSVVLRCNRKQEREGQCKGVHRSS
ncbi:hypothetical protein [Rubritalea tangerina]|uniref:hypothetical protein n=1 Tax=Rubritalea tangerina TaxID=430798 RepID=UPI00361AC8EE